MLTDWSEANSNCLRLGGHLVSIHSENENKIVYEAVKGYNVDVFIGLFVLDSGSFCFVLNCQDSHKNNQ